MYFNFLTNKPGLHQSGGRDRKNAATQTATLPTHNTKYCYFCSAFAHNTFETDCVITAHQNFYGTLAEPIGKIHSASRLRASVVIRVPRYV